VLKGSKTPFESLKLILSPSIENIREMGGYEQVKLLKQVVEDFEKDASE